LSLSKGSADWQSKYEFSVSDLIEKGRNWLGAKTDAVSFKLSKHEKVAPILDELNTKYTDENQLRYEDVVAKDIIYGDITPEQAETKYLESDSYKILTEKYGEDYEKTIKFATSRKNLGALDFAVATWKYGSQKFAYGLGDFALSRVQTPKKLIETTAVVGGVVVTYGAVTGISPAVAHAVNVAVLTGGAGYGAYEVFKPDATPTSAFGGAVLLGTSLAFAGYGAYKYLGRPVVKTVNIKSPVRSYKSHGSIGKDYKIITDKNMVNKIVFESKKLSQYGSAGRRTIVTTKGRLLSNKFWEQLGVPKKFVTMDSNAIYRGVPNIKSYKVGGAFDFKTGSYGIKQTLTSGTKSYFSSIKGLFKVGRQTDYQKAYKLLTKYGYSPSQATQTLRYTAPKVIEQWRSGFLNIKGIKATGQFNVLTKQPVITVDKNLGIKTRGAKTIRDVYDIERKLVMIKDPVTLKSSVYAFQEQTRIGSSILKSGKIVKFKDYDYGVSVIKSKASATQKGYEYLGKINLAICFGMIVQSLKILNP